MHDIFNTDVLCLVLEELDQRCFDTGRRRCLHCRRVVAACPGCRDCIGAELAAGSLDLGEAGA